MRDNISKQFLRRFFSPLQHWRLMKWTEAMTDLFYWWRKK